tara:strand:+ start:56 stop:1999 length:1944 start_codon:yes stop_codon:yes gene_type:complete
MAKLGDLVVRIGADTKDLNKSLGKVQKELRATTSNFTRLGTTITKSVTLPIVGLAAVSVKAFRDQAKAVAQVEQGLKSTGNAAGKTLGELQSMASDLQKTTLFGDEDILQNATAQLLTFTNITGEQFDRTQKAALDLATRLDGDLKSASIQLGKALNDPVANLSALSRSGIQFSAEQKEVIKTLAETGKLAEAQTIILDELNRQYGGSAEAAALADGGFTQLGNAIGDLGEEMGRVVVDNVRPLVEGIRGLVENLTNASDSTKQFAFEFGAIAAIVGPALVFLPQLIGQIQGIRAAFRLLNATMAANPYVAVGVALTALVGTVVLFRNRTDDAVRANDTFIASLKDLDKQAAINEAKARLRELESEKRKLKEAKAIEMQAQAVGALGDKFDKQIARGNVHRYDEQLNALDAQMADLAKRIQGMHQAEEQTPRVFNDSATAASTYAESLGHLFSKLEEVEVQTNAARMSMGEFFSMLEETQVPINEFKTAADTVTTSVNQMGDALATSMGNAIGQATTFKEAMIDAARAIILAYLARAKAKIIQNSAEGSEGTGPAYPFVMAGLITAGMALINRVQIPALAKGGLAYGPTMAMVGDNRNAAIDPEVVAPLSKLKDMMGGGVVEVVGRIKGDDIFLSNARNSSARNRYA